MTIQMSKVKFTIAKDLQTMISKQLFSHSKPLAPMICEILRLFVMHPPFNIKHVIWRSFCFQNKAKITLRQSFLAIYILCNIFYRHVFTAINILCKFSEDIF